MFPSLACGVCLRHRFHQFRVSREAEAVCLWQSPSERATVRVLVQLARQTGQHRRYCLSSVLMVSHDGNDPAAKSELVWRVDPDRRQNNSQRVVPIAVLFGSAHSPINSLTAAGGSFKMFMLICSLHSACWEICGLV